MRFRRLRPALSAVVLLSCMSPRASAQIVPINPGAPINPVVSEPDPARARLRLGPVMLNPGLDLMNLGIDTNVFNQPPGLEQDDFTFTLTPKADVWMKAGPTWISGNVREDLVWYQKFSTERAANTSAAVNWIVPLNRLRFSVGTAYLWARERPSFEIDARVPRRETQFTGAAEVRAFSRTFFGMQGSRRRVDFQDDARFVDTALQFQLNHVATAYGFTARHELTPLTSISIDAGRQNDRFEFSSLRDSDSTVAGVQLILDPSALIKGSARVGYRDFKPVDKSVPGYQGPTVAVDLSYVLLGSTRFGIQVTRDVQYSYDVNQPYFVQNGLATTIQQQIYGPVDAIAGLGFYSLDYRDRTGVVVLYPDRTDNDRSFNFGVGYHMTSDLRIGARLEKQWRDSENPIRRFEGFRVGMVFSYGS
jgi:hypothetical protein